MNNKDLERKDRDLDNKEVESSEPTEVELIQAEFERSKAETERESREGREDVVEDIEQDAAEKKLDEIEEDDEDVLEDEQREMIEMDGRGFFERVNDLFKGDKMNETFKEGGFGAVFSLFYRTITGRHDRKVVIEAIETGHEELLKKFKVVLDSYADKNTLPKKIQLEADDIGILLGKGISTEKDLKKVLDKLPDVDEFVEEHPIFKGKFQRKISLPRYLAIIKRVGNVRIEEEPDEPSPEREGEPEVSEDKEKDSEKPFAESPGRIVNLSGGSSCVFELAGEGHKPIQIMYDKVKIGSRTFNIKVNGADLTFNKITPHIKGAYELDMTGTKMRYFSESKTAMLGSGEVVDMMSSLEKNGSKKKFEYEINKNGETYTFEFSLA